MVDFSFSPQKVWNLDVSISSRIMRFVCKISLSLLETRENTFGFLFSSRNWRKYLKFLHFFAKVLVLFSNQKTDLDISLFSSRNSRCGFHISLSLLDLTFWHLVSAWLHPPSPWICSFLCQSPVPPISIHIFILLFQIAFHDCLKYTDGTGGCDGNLVIWNYQWVSQWLNNMDLRDASAFKNRIVLGRSCLMQSVPEFLLQFNLVGMSWLRVWSQHFF